MNLELFKSDIILENKKALLIPFENYRNQELKEIIFDDKIWEFMGIFIKNENDFESYIQNTLRDKTNDICYPFLIIDKKSNRVAGSSRYGNIHPNSKKCEIGWTWYGTDFQGTGLNKSCKYELLNFGFESIGFRRIQFSADEENLKSQKAIKKLGAKEEGLFRNNYIDSNGVSKNDIYYSIIKEEWSTLKEENFNEFL